VSKEKNRNVSEKDILVGMLMGRNAHSSGGVQAEYRHGGAAGEDAPVGALDGAASGVHGGSGDAALAVSGDGA